MWHKDQYSVCPLVLAIVNEAQTLSWHDRFALIGLCWLYGRSDFPPPPPPPWPGKPHLRAVMNTITCLFYALDDWALKDYRHAYVGAMLILNSIQIKVVGYGAE